MPRWRLPVKRARRSGNLNVDFDLNADVDIHVEIDVDMNLNLNLNATINERPFPVPRVRSIPPPASRLPAFLFSPSDLLLIS